MKPEHYAARARAAHAAAEAAADPRDKTVWRAAAETWERLANPAKDTFSLGPLQRQLDALKRDVATAIDAPASAPAVAEVVIDNGPDLSRLVGKTVRIQVRKPPVAIEF